MSSLHETISSLCARKNVSAYRMCKDIGIRPSIITDLKMGRKKGLSAEVANKIAEYFGVSVGYLLGIEEKEKPAGQMADGQEEMLQIAKKIREANPKLKKFIMDAFRQEAEPKADYVKVKITCPIDGTEQVIYQPVYRIGNIVIPESGNNGCEMCHPCNECTICRLKAVLSLLPDLDSE